MALHRSASAVVIAALGLTVLGCSHDGPQASVGSDIGLYLNTSGSTATLAYGRPNSDDVGLVLQCQAGSRMIDVSDVVRGGAPSSLVLTSGSARSQLPARLDSSTGQATLWAKANVSAPALVAFRGTGRIGVAVGGARYGIAASCEEQAQVESFFRTCESA
jgi:hypothetical protein